MLSNQRRELTDDRRSAADDEMKSLGLSQVGRTASQAGTAATVLRELDDGELGTYGVMARSPPLSAACRIHSAITSNSCADGAFASASPRRK